MLFLGVRTRMYRIRYDHMHIYVEGSGFEQSLNQRFGPNILEGGDQRTQTGMVRLSPTPALVFWKVVAFP